MKNLPILYTFIFFLANYSLIGSTGTKEYEKRDLGNGKCFYIDTTTGKPAISLPRSGDKIINPSETPNSISQQPLQNQEKQLLSTLLSIHLTSKK